MVEVIQADRNEAALFACWFITAERNYDENRTPFFAAGFPEGVRQGAWDNHDLVQAFARHRLSTTTRVDATDGEREAILAGLADPHVVHVSMLRGTIAKPSVRSIIHIYGEEQLLAEMSLQPAAEAEADEVGRLREALEKCVFYIGSPFRMSTDDAEDARRAKLLNEARTALNRADNAEGGAEARAERGPLYHRPAFECAKCQTPTTCALYGRCMPIIEGGDHVAG